MQRISACLFFAIAICTLAAACDSKSDKAAPGGKQAAGIALPAGLFLSSPPTDAREVKAAKGGAAQGKPVVLRGRVGGSEQPFSPGTAIFTLVDFALPACSDNPDDKCATPWDYCCERPEDIVAHAATVQVVDAAGKPLKVGLNGLGGLVPLSEVLVVGTVAQRDDGGVFIVNATGLFVVKPK